MNVLEQFRDINTFIFDVDGVLTNSELIITEKGELLRKMNAKDGYAMRKAIIEGYNVCIITGGNSAGVVDRLKALGVQEVYYKIHNKLKTLQEYVETYDIDLNRTLYMGDDIPDHPVMRKVALPTCPADACHEIKEISQYISPINGGRGCVRDVIEKVLRLHGKWMEGGDETVTKLDLE